MNKIKRFCRRAMFNVLNDVLDQLFGELNVMAIKTIYYGDYTGAGMMFRHLRVLNRDLRDLGLEPRPITFLIERDMYVIGQ